jgi:hypothetical protein
MIHVIIDHNGLDDDDLDDNAKDNDYDDENDGILRTRKFFQGH